MIFLSLFASSSPLVSVVTPVGGPGQRLQAAVRSVMKQTIASQIEVIVVVDGQQQAATEALQELEEEVFSAMRLRQLGGFEALSLENNQGPFQARWAGVRQARGRYVLFLDADDVLVGPSLLEEVLGLMGGRYYEVVQFPVFTRAAGHLRADQFCNHGTGTLLYRAGLREALRKQDISSSLQGKLWARGLLVQAHESLGGEYLREARVYTGEDHAVSFLALSQAQNYTSVVGSIVDQFKRANKLGSNQIEIKAPWEQAKLWVNQTFYKFNYNPSGVRSRTDPLRQIADLTGIMHRAFEVVGEDLQEAAMQLANALLDVFNAQAVTAYGEGLCENRYYKTLQAQLQKVSWWGDLQLVMDCAVPAAGNTSREL